MIRRVEDGKHRTTNDLDVMLVGDPDHFREPVRIGIFIVIKHGDKFRRRVRAAGPHEGLVIGVGVAAARFDVGTYRETKGRRDLFDNAAPARASASLSTTTMLRLPA